MKTLITLTTCCILTGILFFACQKDQQPAKVTEEIPATVLTKISALGFSKKGVIKVKSGYLVEGDILLTESDLDKKQDIIRLHVAETEHYRTNRLILFGVDDIGSRILYVSVENLSANYITAVDAAIARYNALQLRIRFTRIQSGGQIVIANGALPADVLGSSGFPDGNGNPANRIVLNVGAIGNNFPIGWMTSIITHELGHCIGFRHTDYANRNYSCGSDPHPDEGQSSSGAILIPGTPSGPDADSWMLACSNGTDRPFTTNDQLALNYLYGCGYEGSKVINGICETGEKRYTSSVRQGNVYRCTYVYVFSDGSVSRSFFSTGSFPCLVDPI
ncbi:M57 family metalloprotease [Chitinophaga solisilvae]|uniref:M57 family metalloprotease n=1 Tax=Chitinophaga solisilvae TaxID=1233460 RepID=UPI00136C65AF|nr:M57 family metalloprotease [Chitinophaga solisilvae]